MDESTKLEITYPHHIGGGKWELSDGSFTKVGLKRAEAEELEAELSNESNVEEYSVSEAIAPETFADESSEESEPDQNTLEPKRMTVRNNTRRRLTLIDAEGNGVRIDAKDEVSVEADLVGPDFQAKARAGLVSLS